jgi:hypothetical protein
MLFIATGICDDKLRPQILSVGTTANSPFKGRMEINALLMENTTFKYVRDKVIASNILDGSVLLVVVSATMNGTKCRFYPSLSSFYFGNPIFSPDIYLSGIFLSTRFVVFKLVIVMNISDILITGR